MFPGDGLRNARQPDAIVAADLAIAIVLVGAAALVLLRRDVDVIVFATTLAITTAWIRLGAPIVGLVELGSGLLAWRTLRAMPDPSASDIHFRGGRQGTGRIPPSPSMVASLVTLALAAGVVVVALAFRVGALPGSTLTVGAAALVVVTLHRAIVGTDATGRIAALRLAVGACVLLLGVLTVRRGAGLEWPIQFVAATALVLNAIGTLQGAALVRRLGPDAGTSLDEDLDPAHDIDGARESGA